MAPAPKRCKVSAVTTGNLFPCKLTPDIATFGRISKAGNGQQSSSKDVKNQKDLGSISCSVSLETVEVITKKRKLVEQQRLPEEHGEVDQLPVTVKNIRASTEVYSSPSVQAVPCKRRPPRPNYAETPTKGTRAFLAAFTISSSSRSVKSSPPSTVPASANSLSSTRVAAPKLPEELQDLIDLHSAFMKALSLHYAHNGSFAPVDLRILRPSLERIWGKRRISTEDIQRIFGILSISAAPVPHNDTPIPVTLSDYGSGKICIEVDVVKPRNSSGPNLQHLDVDGLNKRFGANLHELWWRLERGSEIASFLSSLPLAPINVCTSLAKTAPLLAKGQLRLTDLKAGAIRAQFTSIATKAPVSSTTTATQIKPASLRQSTLLERIRAKEAHQSTLPNVPSPETIACRSALQRIEEVIPILELLTTSQIQSKNTKLDAGVDGTEGDRIFSFTLPTVIQHLQMSLRNPISKEEAIRCLGLLAEVIAPEWVGMRDVGKAKGITIRRRGVRRREIEERVEAALGEEA